MQTYFYADEQSNPIGPRSLDELKALFDSGSIHEMTPVIIEGDSTWSEYRKVAIQNIENQNIVKQNVSIIQTSNQGSVAYDPMFLEKFAARLYLKANLITVILVLIFGLFGAIAGAIILSVIGFLFGGIFGAVFGYVIGRLRAIMLKVKAQMVLCLVQIEKNTKGH